MTRLRVALRVPVGRPLPDIAAFVARCEDAGFDGVGIHDHPSSGRDAYLALALAARATAICLDLARMLIAGLTVVRVVDARSSTSDAPLGEPRPVVVGLPAWWKSLDGRE